MDLVKVANACAVECVRQKVGIEELGFLLEAYNWWYEKVADWRDIMMTREPMPIRVDDLVILGSFIEPAKTRRGYRKIPVTFQNSGGSCPASEIDEQMIKLVDHINNDRENYEGHEEAFARKITSDFLWIHPFEDGNGRTGFLLWNWLMGTLDEPTALPDFNW